MKTTLEIDDSLYREAKAYSALTGRKMKDLVSDGLRQMIQPVKGKEARSAKETDAAFELRQWFKAVDKAVKSTPAGVSALELLKQDRQRLETP
jgi:negative regulator of replication initiation